MGKIDLKKQYKKLYSAPVGEFSIIDVPPLTYFAIDGAGDPAVEGRGLRRAVPQA